MDVKYESTGFYVFPQGSMIELWKWEKSSEINVSLVNFYNIIFETFLSHFQTNCDASFAHLVVLYIKIDNYCSNQGLIYKFTEMITHLWKGVTTEYEGRWSAGSPEKIDAREDGKTMWTSNGA